MRAIHFSDHAGVEFIGVEDRRGVSALRLQREMIAFSQEAVLLGQQRLYIDGSHHGDGSTLQEATVQSRWRSPRIEPPVACFHRARGRTDGRDGGAVGAVGNSSWWN